MIAPVKRTTHYPLLLKDLKKCTSVGHPDEHDLELAFVAMESLAQSVDSIKHQEEEKTDLYNAYHSTVNCPLQLLNARRRLLMQYDVTDKDKRPYHIAICSDLIMLTQSQALKKKKLEQNEMNEKPWKFICWLDLKECTV
ncbi:hypothetical protein HK096_006689, partial [Nowakowskiella sp. JEL0078]